MVNMSNVNQILDENDWRIGWGSLFWGIFEVVIGDDDGGLGDKDGTICEGGESNRFDEGAKRKRENNSTGCWLNNGVGDVDGKNNDDVWEIENEFELNVLLDDADEIIGRFK